MPVPAGPANIPADPVVVADRASGTVIRTALARAATTPDRVMWADAKPGAGGEFRGPVINDRGGRLDKPWLAVGPRTLGAPGTMIASAACTLLIWIPDARQEATQRLRR